MAQAKMSRQHFILIAQTLAGCKPRDSQHVWNDVVVTFANKLNATNPQFDRARFLTACGYQGN